MATSGFERFAAGQDLSNGVMSGLTGLCNVRSWRQSKSLTLCLDREHCSDEMPPRCNGQNKAQN